MCSVVHRANGYTLCVQVQCVLRRVFDVWSAYVWLCVTAVNYTSIIYTICVYFPGHEVYSHVYEIDTCVKSRF